MWEQNSTLEEQKTNTQLYAFINTLIVNFIDLIHLFFHIHVFRMLEKRKPTRTWEEHANHTESIHGNWQDFLLEATKPACYPDNTENLALYMTIGDMRVCASSSDLYWTIPGIPPLSVLEIFILTTLNTALSSILSSNLSTSSGIRAKQT